MKMIDLGEKSSGLCEAPEKNKKWYPSITVPLSLVKGKALGTECRFEFVGKITSIEESERRSDARIELKSGKYLAKAGKKSKEEYKEMSDDEREEYDKESMND